MAAVNTAAQSMQECGYPNGVPGPITGLEIPRSGHGRREIAGNSTAYHFPPVKENPVVGLATPRYAWCD